MTLINYFHTSNHQIHMTWYANVRQIVRSLTIYNGELKIIKFMKRFLI